MTNKFISWDEKTKKFYEFGLFDTDNYYLLDHSINLDINTAHNNTFTSIGKKDINNKEIYVDSSIVEFQMIIGEDVEKVQAHFYYDDDDMAYGIDILSGDVSSGRYSFHDMIGIEVIDSLQENKLGLIK